MSKTMKNLIKMATDAAPGVPTMPTYTSPLWFGSSRHPSSYGWRIDRHPDGSVYASTSRYSARQSCRTHYAYSVCTLPTRAPRIVRDTLQALTGA